MNKTLQRTFSPKNNRLHTATTEITSEANEMTNLLQEMKHYLQEAATDLLQPRPEAVLTLLKKARQSN